MQLRPNTSLNHKSTKMKAFQALQEIHDEQVPVDTDDATVPSGNQIQSTRLQLMVSNHPTSTSADGLLKAVREILAAMKNKLPSIKFAQWRDKIKTGKKPKLVDQLPSDVEKAEVFLQNFSRFSSGKKGYFRIQVIHDEQVPVTLLEDISRSFNVKQQQSLYLATSDAINPQVIGLLIGSTETMATSPDTQLLLQKLSQVPVIGMNWKHINNGEKGKFNQHQKAIYIETESDTAQKLRNFLTSYLNEEQQDIFGAALTFLPSNQYPTLNQVSKIKKYTPLQTNLVKSLREYQVEISTFYPVKVQTSKGKEDSTTTTATLIERVLNVESIVPKMVVTSKETSSYKGKVFYAAVTDYESNQTTFQYQEYNEQEATSILRALPLFLQDHFGIKKEQTLCRSAHRVAASNGQWTYATRSFLSQQDLKEKVQFENLEMLTTATQQTSYISADHQRMMMGEALEEASNITDLRNNQETQGDETSELTTNTGSTRTSKAKAIAEKQVKEISRQYVQQQQEDKKRIKDQQDQLKAQKQQMDAMQKMMTAIMKKTQGQEGTEKDKEIEIHSSTDPDSGDSDDDASNSSDSSNERMEWDTKAIPKFYDPDSDSAMEEQEDRNKATKQKDQRMNDRDEMQTEADIEIANTMDNNSETLEGPPSPKRKHHDTVTQTNLKRTTRSSTAGGTVC